MKGVVAFSLPTGAAHDFVQLLRNLDAAYPQLRGADNDRNPGLPRTAPLRLRTPGPRLRGG